MRKKTYLKLVDYQTEQSEKHLNEVRSIHKEMRGYKHDFHHHLQTLKGQLEAGEIERALAYIEQLDTQLMQVDTLLKTGNVSLDAILSAKIAQAKAEAITVTVKANVPDILTISDLELSIVIGNLLDNAIESCRTVTEERFIRIFISMKGTMLYFSMLNTAGPKKKKTGLIVAICVVVVLALGAGAYFLFFTPEKRYERKMDVAEKAMTDSNYEEAVTAYEAALGIFDDRVPAMNGLLSAQISAGESDGARENFTEFRTTITGFDADKVTENSEDIVAFYEYADDLYSDTDSLIDAYKEGYNLTNDNGLKKNLVTAYVDRADAMDNSDYENKIAAYGDALDLDSTNESALSGRKACAYAVLDDMMDAQQYDQAESFINTYADSMSDVDFSSYTEKIESERALMTARHDLMEQVISLMSASDYAGMMDVDGSDNASTVVANMDGDSYVYATDGYDSSYTGKAAGVYTYSTLLSSGYYFYYGDYENGVRSGQGTMFVKMDGYNQAYLVYEGAWSNDKPNGAGTETSVNEDAGDELVTVTRSGNLVDGLFDGEVTVSLVSNDEEYGGTYTGTFTASNGDAPDIRENYPDLDFSDVSEDKTVYVVLECDGSPMYWHFSKGSAAKLGIHTFGN